MPLYNNPAMNFAQLAGPFAPTSTGAVAATRYVGGTTSGAPTTGTFAKGDFIIDQTGKIWINTVAGSPGTWVLAQSGASAPFPGAPGVSGAIYRSSLNGMDAQVAAGGALGKMQFRRILLGAGTLDRILAHHIGSPTASELLRLGIYNDSIGRPGSLLLDAGTIDLSTAAGVKLITISQVITAGFYWLGCVRQGPGVTATMVVYASSTSKSDAGAGWTEITAASIYDGSQAFATKTGVTGALPDPFGSPTMSTADQTQPLVAVRYL